MKKAFFILNFLLFATFTFAQQAINQTLIDYLDNLNKAQVPTGILVEQGFPMYDLQEYKGQVLTDSNKIDADLFGWLYMGLAAGNVNSNTVIPDPQVYSNMYNNSYMGGNLPLVRRVRQLIYFTFNCQVSAAREHILCDAYYSWRL